MSKFAIEIVYTRTYTTNYVIEAEDDFEARHIADELVRDYDFLNDAACKMGEFYFDYEVGDVLEVDDSAVVGEFFNE